MFMRKARNGLRSDCESFSGELRVPIFGLLQVLKARERKRIPLSRIRSFLLDRKAGIIQQRAKRTVGELVAGCVCLVPFHRAWLRAALHHLILSGGSCCE